MRRNKAGEERQRQIAIRLLTSSQPQRLYIRAIEIYMFQEKTGAEETGKGETDKRQKK